MTNKFREWILKQITDGDRAKPDFLTFKQLLLKYDELNPIFNPKKLEEKIFEQYSRSVHFGRELATITVSKQIIETLEHDCKTRYIEGITTLWGARVFVNPNLKANEFIIGEFCEVQL